MKTTAARALDWYQSTARGKAQWPGNPVVEILGLSGPYKGRIEVKARHMDGNVIVSHLTGADADMFYRHVQFTL